MDQITVGPDTLPEWMRTSFLDDDGELFLPCGALADEQIALLCIVHDRVQVVKHHGHIYAPASWLAKEYPHHAETINAIVASVMDAELQCVNESGVRK